MYEPKIIWIEDTPFGYQIGRTTFIPPHMHENLLEIIYCMNGTIKFDYAYDELTLNEGEFIAVDRDMHRLHSGDNAVLAFIYIDISYFSDIHPGISDLSFICEYCTGSLHPKRKAHEMLKATLIALLYFIAISDSRDPGYKETITGSTNEIINLFMDKFDILAYFQPDGYISPEIHSHIRNILKYIHTHYSEKLTLSDLSRQVHLTVPYVSEMLSKYVICFEDIVGYIRACHSEKLLFLTDMTVAEISEECGFSATRYYYKAFKQWYKCTPKQFRDFFLKKGNEEKEAFESLSSYDMVPFLQKIILEHYMELFLEKAPS